MITDEKLKSEWESLVSLVDAAEEMITDFDMNSTRWKHLYDNTDTSAASGGKPLSITGTHGDLNAGGMKLLNK